VSFRRSKKQMTDSWKKTNAKFDEWLYWKIKEKKGFGKALITYCEKKSFGKNVDLIWFNARIEATDFYEKMGCQKRGFYSKFLMWENTS
jgi:hypothetical protein